MDPSADELEAGAPDDVAALEAAARLALGRDVWAAAYLLDRALEVLPAGDERRHRLASELGAIATWAGRPRHAETWLRDCIRHEKEGASRARLMVHLAQALAVQDRWADALTVLAEVTDAEGLDAEIVAQAAAERALALAQNRDLADARAAAEEVLAGLPDATAAARSVALEALALCDFFEGHTEAATETLARAVSAAAAGDDLSLRWRNLQMLVGIFLANSGDCDGALAALAQARSAASRWGARWAIPACQWYLGFVLFRRGRWDEAWQALAEGLDDARWGETTWEEGGLLGTSAVISARQGYLRRAEALVSKMEERPQTVHSDATWRDWATAIVAERRGEADAALAVLEGVRTRCLDQGVSGSIRGIYPDLCRLALQQGRTQLLESVVAEFEDHARDGAPSSMEAAFSAHCRGIARRDEGALQHAISIYSSGRQDLYLALAFEELAVVRAEKGSSKRAREASREALSRYELMKADMDAARARARLRMLKISSPPIGSSVRATRSLTKTETVVAELVAEGLQNKEIATRLFVTVGTIQTHLKSIFRKLGVTSRTQLAVALVDETRDDPAVGARS